MAIVDFSLAKHDEAGFCNILLCALGGDGANMAGKLLFKIGCTYLGLDGGYDAAYGSEKKGTATDVSVRFCAVGTPVRQAGPTDRPHYVVVFHDDLIEPLALGRGLEPGGTCVVNTVRPPSEIRNWLPPSVGRLVTVDATRIAYETGSRLNMPLFSALCHELRFPDEKVTDIIARQWPKAATANVSAFKAALVKEKSEAYAAKTVEPAWRPGERRGPIGWRNMLNGGTIDAMTHSTIHRDNRIAGRGNVPRFDQAACNSCGICLTVCSDPGGLLWREGRMEGIDPAFCKGCMRCVEVCPRTKKGRALDRSLNGAAGKRTSDSA